MATEIRKWFNKALKEIAPEYTGSIINVGAGPDEDNEGNHYKDYFVNADSYKTLDAYYDKCDYDNIDDLSLNSFDVVLNFWVLEHVFNMFDFIHKLSLICKKTLIIAVPVRYEYHPAPGDYWRFTFEGIEKLLKKYNFMIEKFNQYEDEKHHGILIIAEKLT